MKDDDYLMLLRKEIDNIDDNICHLLGKRQDISREIGIIKKHNNLPLLDSNRWNKVLERIAIKAEKEKLSVDFIQEIYNIIHKYSIIAQEKQQTK